jgi:26S proteasome regulatory subunit N8
MAQTSSQIGTEVIVHPLVLLSVTDHYNRVAKDTKNRVVGVLLGSKTQNRVDITNSFAVPFEEESNNPKVWFLDHNFLENMHWMFKKVNSMYFSFESKVFLCFNITSPSA